jgi:hypothetical protein
MKIHKTFPGYEYWYDPQVRVWYAAAVDAAKNILRITDAYDKQSIEILIKRGF